jgi:hypothetical protein
LSKIRNVGERDHIVDDRGLPNNPWIAGNGGLKRTTPRLPSDFGSEVSSPQMYPRAAPHLEIKAFAGTKNVVAEIAALPLR